MITGIIVGVIVVVCVIAIVNYGRKLRRGCCTNSDAQEKKVHVQDRDRSHYPYETVIAVEGMVCSKCTRRVENALNSMDGVWAEADAEKNIARVRMKREIPAAELCRAVREAGYTAYLRKKD